MSTDNWTPGAVDLVIFTVADPSTMPSLIWDKSMVSFGDSNPEAHTGLSLFVLTVAAPTDLDKYFPGRRILPGGHLQWDETLLEASRRIADDRLGIDFKKIRARLRQLGTFDDPERDPRGRALSFAYWSIVNFEDVRKYLGGRDQPILAQDHDDMVFYAWRALRHAFDARLDPFSYLGLNPISEEFRLSDLQELTEVCRGERVQRDLFRRNVKNLDFLAASGNFDRSRPGKPATMYYSPLALDQNSDKKDSSD